MSKRKHTHRKRIPRSVDPMAMFKVFNKIAPFTETELLKLELPIRMAFEALKTGRGTQQDWSDIAAAINVVIIRSHDVDPRCVQAAEDASDALMRAWLRHQSTGAWGFDGPAITEIEVGITLHEQFCRLSTPLQMMQAMRRVVNIRAAAGVTS